MKVGLSFSRCVKDIYENLVSYDDVLIIIARTDFDPNNDEQWNSIWKGYHAGGGWINSEWRNIPLEDEDKVRAICISLYNDGKLHQPRQFGAHPPRRPEYWLETVLPSSELESNPAAKAAWNNFQVVAGLTNTKLDKEYQ